MTETNLIENLRYITLDEVVNGTKWIEDIDASGAEIDDKISMVLAAVECPQEYLDLFKLLVSLLQELITKSFSKRHTITVRAFGSSATNLALKICDLDLFVKMDPAPKNNYDRKWFLTLRKIFSVFKGELFTQMIYIEAKVPILKCLHAIGISCDISANNEQALKNTDLIKFLVSLNKGFRPLFLMIKLWIKRGSDSVEKSFKGYLVALMTVFFLQQKNLLPSVQLLQENHKTNEPCVLNSWNCYFNDDASHFSHITNQNLVVTDLLKDFFDFYSKFEFGFYIISPNCGEKILKPLKNEEKSGQFKGYLSVLDVFQLDFCPSVHVPRQAVMDFQSHCREACAAWEESELLFSSIFSKNENKPQKKKKKKKSSDLCLIVGNSTLTGNTEDEIRDKWFTNAITAVEDLLRQVARLNITSKEDGSFTCLTTSPSMFNRKMRSKVRQDLEAAPGVLEFCPETLKTLTSDVAVSAVIAAEETITSEPLELKISYALNTLPTKIEFTADAVKTVSDSQQHQVLHSFCQCFANWLSKL